MDELTPLNFFLIEYKNLFFLIRQKKLFFTRFFLKSTFRNTQSVFVLVACLILTM